MEFSQATPTIVRPSEAMQWLNAHHIHSPITRHALVVLESIDAIDLAFDTFVGALLDGEVDTSGYPEYSAVVGGVASHWDEGTGDMIVRAVVGWGGKGVRGDTDRIGARLLAGHLHERPGQPVRHGHHQHRAAGPGRRPGRPRVRPLRVRLGPRAGLLLPEVRHAPAPRLTAPDDQTGPAARRSEGVPTYDYRCTVCGHEIEVVHGVHGHGPDACPVCGGAMRKAFVVPAIHFKGSGWAKKDRGASSSTKAARRPEPATARSPGRGRRLDGRDHAESAASSATPGRPAEGDRREPARGETLGPADERELGDGRRRRPTGSPWPRRRASSRRPTSTSGRPRSAAGRGPGSSRASSSAGAATSSAARSGR